MAELKNETNEGLNLSKHVIINQTKNLVNKRKRRSLHDQENTSQDITHKKKRHSYSKSELPMNSSPVKKQPLTEIKNEVEVAKFVIDDDKVTADSDTFLIDLNKSSIKEADELLKEDKSLVDNDLSPIKDKSTINISLPLETTHSLQRLPLTEFQTTIIHVERTKSTSVENLNFVYNETNQDLHQYVINEAKQFAEQVWVENYELIKKTESLVSSTPSKIEINSTDRLYHLDEVVLEQKIIQLSNKNLIESFTSPFLIKEEKIDAKDDLEEEVDQQTKTIKTESQRDDEVATENTSRSSRELKSDLESESVNAFNFASNLLHTELSPAEIKLGIFGDKNNNSRSKTQIPFSNERTEQFIGLIAENFMFEESEMDKIWALIRPKLNNKLCRMRRQL